MTTTVKCPDCGGMKCNELSSGRYRCQYCGSTFVVDSELPVEQPQPTKQDVAPQIIYIQQLQQQPAQPEKDLSQRKSMKE